MNHINFKRNFVIGIIAGVFYFFVALIANYSHGLSKSVDAAIIHGALCFAATFTSSSIMEFFFNCFEDLLAKYLGSIICSGACTLSVMSGVHYLNGTPNILGTVLSSALLSIPYYMLFPLKLIDEYEKSIDRLAYRSDENKSIEWKVRKLSRPYHIRDFLKVLSLNLLGHKKKKTVNIEILPKSFFLNNGLTQTRVGFLGDLMPMYSKEWLVCDELKERISSLDYLVCNFEGLLTRDSSVLLGQYHNENILESLKSLLPASQIILSVANNHSADSGYQSFLENIDILESHGFLVIGSKEKPSIELNGHINLVASTQWSNQHHGYLSFFENSENHLKENYVNILYPHWNNELELYPRPEQEELASRLLDDWDAIIGHHTHIPGPITKYIKNNVGKLVAYSLGDSTTALPRPMYRHGMFVEIDTGVSSVLKGRWEFTKLVTYKNQIELTINQKSFEEHELS